MSQTFHCFVVANYCAIIFLNLYMCQTCTPPQPHGRFWEWIRTNPTRTSTWGWSRGLCWGLRDIGEKETDDPHLISSLLTRLEPFYRLISQFLQHHLSSYFQLVFRMFWKNLVLEAIYQVGKTFSVPGVLASYEILEKRPNLPCKVLFLGLNAQFIPGNHVHCIER